MSQHDATLEAQTTEQPQLHERRGPFRPHRLAPVRERLSGRLVARLFRLADATALIGVTLGIWLSARTAVAGAPALIVAPLAALAALGIFNAYDFGRGEGLVRHLARALSAVPVAVATAFLTLGFSLPGAALAHTLTVWTLASGGVLLPLHGVWWSLIGWWRRRGRLAPNLVIVGATPAAERLIATALSNHEVNVLGVFDDRLGRAPGSLRGVPILGDTQALLDHRIMPYVDRIVISVPPSAGPRIAQLIERLRVLPNEICLLMDGAENEGGTFARLADVPLAHISGPPGDAAKALVKRMQDLVVGSLALVAALPVMALVALAVRLDSPGSILFRQRRHGFNNEEIVVWKFRSMRVEASDAKAARQVSAEDDRVTRVGRFIRKTSLDELPQLLNVLKGEMSLVGPRPHAIGMMTDGVESARLVAEYAHRHRMKPGMTGWAAIRGSRGPVATPESVRQRVALDVEYIERQSFWFDLYIIAMTIPCLLGDRAAIR